MSQSPTAAVRRFFVLSTILTALFGLYFFAMAVCNFFRPRVYPWLLACLLLLLVAALLLVLRATASPVARRGAVRACAVCGGLVLLLLQRRLALSLYGTVAYDCSNVISAARNLADSGSLGEWRIYFANFPNNSLLLLVCTAVFRLCNLVGYANRMWALVCCNLVVVDLSVLLTLLCARRLLGARGVALTLFFAMPLLVLHYGIAVPYTDTFGLLFPILALYLYLRLPGGGPAALGVSALMGLVAAMGYQMKPQTVIVCIAIALVSLFSQQLTRQRLVRLGQLGLCFLLALILTLMGLHALTQTATGGVLTPELQQREEVPITHYLMMGMNAETDGFISDEDWSDTLDHPGKSNKMKYNLAVIGERLAAFGPGGYAAFLFAKSRAIWGGIHMDMWVRSPFHNSDDLSRAIQAIFYSGGVVYPVYWMLMQAFWVLMLLLWVVPAALCPAGVRDTRIAVLRLSIVGLALFLLLFEGGPRYLFHQTPFFILLAAWGALQLRTCGHNAAALWAKRPRRGSVRAAKSRGATN